MIRLEHVTKRYGDTPAVNELSLEIDEGLVCVLIGPSGCGKTTTLRMVNRLIEPTSGHIFVDGKDISKVKPEDLRRSIGYAIQSVGLFPHMTVAANIAIVPGLLHWDKRRIASRVDELLTLVGLSPEGSRAKYPYELSGGEAQRVGVARALAADPPILLMDEPFGAVDPLTRERLQTQFASIQATLKKTVILVTHDLDEAIRLADRIAIMESGRLVQYDTPEVILSKPKNKFVHDFVGADHALKRLSRIRVEAFVKPAPTVRLGASMPEVAAALDGYRWGWVTEAKGRPVGWIDGRDLATDGSLDDAIVQVDMDEVAVTQRATLREALARMLGNGMKSLPVIDEQGRLIGEITLHDVEAATAEGEA